MYRIITVFLISMSAMPAFAQQVIAWGSAAQNLNIVPAQASPAISVSAGGMHSVALRADGHVVVWGDHARGQANVPPALQGVIAVAAGRFHTMALQDNGRVVCWGGADAAVITPPPGLQNVIAIAAGAYHCVALQADGKVVTWGTTGQSYWQVPAALAGQEFIAVAAGEEHTVALLPNGTVAAWGDNTRNQLDVPALANVIAIAAGDHHSLALLANGTVHAWGDNNPADGDQLTIPAAATNVIAIAGGGGHSVALKSDGTVIAWGANDVAQATVPVQAKGIVALAAGGKHTIAVTSGGLTVRAWGNASFNAMTVPSRLFGVKDMKMGSDFSSVLRSDGTVVGWGKAPASAVPAGTDNIKEIANGLWHTAALRANGTATAWGQNQNYQAATVPPALANIKKLESHAMGFHTVALLANGTVTGWGRAASGYTLPAADNHDVRSIGAGDYHTLVVYANGTVKGFGFNNAAQIDPAVTNTLTNVKAAGGGRSYSAVLRADGSFLVWGRRNQSSVPAINLNGIKSMITGADVLFALRSDGTVIGWGTGNDGELTPLPYLANVYALTAGTRSVGVVTSNPPPAIEPAVTDVYYYETVPRQPTYQAMQPPVTVTGNFIQSISLQIENTHLDNMNFYGVTGNRSPCNQPICVWYTSNATTGTSQLSGENPAAGYTTILRGMRFLHQGNDFGMVRKVTAIPHDGIGFGEPSIINVHLVPVNRAPVFVKGGDVTLLEDAPPSAQTFPQWATQISPGLAVEQHQKLNFQVQVDAPALFEVLPSIDAATGTLTFKLAKDANGVARASVILLDDGGTARGGVDKSATQTFTITVTPVNDAPMMAPVADQVMSYYDTELAVDITSILPGPPNESGQRVTVTAVSADKTKVPDPAVTYAGGNAGIVVLRHTAYFSGPIEIVVTLRDDGGTAFGGEDERAYSFTITLREQVAPVFIPTLFSPNGDGTNDVLRVLGDGIASIHFAVFTNDGKEVFSTTDVAQATLEGWNGTYRGSELPTGTYVWALSGVYLDGNMLSYHGRRSGQVLLVR